MFDVVLFLMTKELIRSNKAEAAKWAALEECQEALTQATLDGDTTGQVTNLIRIAEIDVRVSVEEKRGHYQHALAIAQNAGDPRLETIASVFLARFLFGQEDYGGASLYYKNALGLASQTKDSKAQALIEEELRNNEYQLKFMQIVNESK